MVERNKGDLDKTKADREKKIKKVRRESKEDRRLEKDLRDVSTGRVTPEEFDEKYGG